MWDAIDYRKGYEDIYLVYIYIYTVCIYIYVITKIVLNLPASEIYGLHVFFLIITYDSWDEHERKVIAPFSPINPEYSTLPFSS